MLVGNSFGITSEGQMYTSGLNTSSGKIGSFDIANTD
jgi:hypothetical protein